MWTAGGSNRLRTILEVGRRNISPPDRVLLLTPIGRQTMGFGRGALLWRLGIPLPIILLLALFWHH